MAMGNLQMNIIVAITILWINITSCQELTPKYTQRENPSKDEITEDKQHTSININNLKDMGLLDNTHNIFGPKADIVYGPNNVKTENNLLKASRRQKFHPYWSIPDKMRREITRTQHIGPNKMRKKVKPNQKIGPNGRGNKRPHEGWHHPKGGPFRLHGGGNKKPQPRPNKRPSCRGKLCKYKKGSDRMKPIKELEDISVEFRVDPYYNRDGDYPDMGQEALAGYQLPEDYGGMGWDASEYFPVQGLLPSYWSPHNYYSV